MPQNKNGLHVEAIYLSLLKLLCDPLHPERNGKADDRTYTREEGCLYYIFGMNIRYDSK